MEAAESLGTEVVVVDNASRDGTLQLLREAARSSNRLQLIELSRNVGYATALNRAFGELEGLDVLVLNPDLALQGAESVRALADVLVANPQAGLVAPRLHDANGAVQPSARRPASLAAMLGSLRPTLPPLRKAYERYLAPATSPRPHAVGWVIGAAMLIRRTAYDAVGGFDEGFFLYMEDADFCRRLNRAGWDVLYVPAIRVQHGYARSSSAPGASIARSPARRRHFRSLLRYWRKHPATLLGGER